MFPRTFKAVLLGFLLYFTAGVWAKPRDTSKVLSIGVVLFPGFQPLDVIGPLDMIFLLSGGQNMTLSTIWKETGPIWARAPPLANSEAAPPPAEGTLPSTYPLVGPHIVATHTFASAPKLDILLVPGGGGNVVLSENNDTVIEDFLVSRFDELEYLISVCTGAVSLAKSGLLNGRNATTSKYAWSWVTQFGQGVKWTPNARWVEDGKIWTSSGVSSGLDMTYALFKKILGEKATNIVVNAMEYTPHQDRHWDAFAVVHKVPGADTKRPLGDCVGPAGYDFKCARDKTH
ncbi:class I glutamine amidotransferase-like protein [Cercophora scortea]|uniref:Class I glutamine amidotransferase-like protein n=1 Tax=Cercophora scortea TaxID=314031 RepID=A0AAE0IVQ7_9PEZI|nr:class I glutamine amidotransferase-like protein [Cercophora scortea]